MSRNFKIGLVIGVVAALLIAGFINFWIWPFKAQNPNFSDVESVFARIQIPSDWEEISSSENRGTAGRTCPIESESKCFHKSKTYSIDTSTSDEKIKSVFLTSGCPVVSSNAGSYRGEMVKRTNFECTIDGVNIYGESINSENSVKILVGVST